MSSYAFNNITNPTNVQSVGSLKISSDGFHWKDNKGASHTIKASHIQGAEWCAMYANCKLKVMVHDENSFSFRGFSKKDLETVQKALLSLFNVEVKTTSLSVIGRNWGEVSFEGSSLVRFDTESNGTAFELPLSEITQAVMQAKSKNEVSIEIQPNSTGPDDDELTEVRLWIPSKLGDPEDEPPAKRFHASLTARGGIDANAGNILYSFPDLNFHTPRGRFFVNMMPKYMQLQGRTLTHTVRYTSIVQLYKLPRIDLSHDVLMITLDPPLRQGNTTYPNVIITFPRDEEPAKIEAKMDEKEIAERYQDKLTKHIEGEMVDLVGTVLKVLSGKTIIASIPFRSSRSEGAVRCSYKQNEGQLFLLEKRFVFLLKPPLVIKYSHVQGVEFARAQSRQCFDLVVRTSEAAFQFGNIPQSEFDPVSKFVEEKNIKVTNLTQQNNAPVGLVDDGGDDTDESDGEFNPAAGSDSTSSAESDAASE